MTRPGLLCDDDGMSDRRADLEALGFAVTECRDSKGEAYLHLRKDALWLDVPGDALAVDVDAADAVLDADARGELDVPVDAIAPDNVHAETATGPDVGAEVVSDVGPCDSVSVDTIGLTKQARP